MKVPFVSFLPLEEELNSELHAAFERVLKNSWYIDGKEDKAFEEAFASFCDSNYCVGVGNGLDALMLALRAFEIGEGDEVIVPSNTYIATALAVTYVGATPVFVEPDTNTYNIDPALIEEKITDKTKAIMPVHLYGQPCDMDPIMEITLRLLRTALRHTAQPTRARSSARSATPQALAFTPERISARLVMQAPRLQTTKRLPIRYAPSEITARITSTTTSTRA